MGVPGASPGPVAQDENEGVDNKCITLRLLAHDMRRNSPPIIDHKCGAKKGSQLSKMLNQENKTKMVTLRMTETDLNYLDKEAKKVKLSRSEYINRKIMALAVQPANLPGINWKTYRELAKIASQLSAIGNNINQIAKAINTAQANCEPIPTSLPHPKE